MNHIFRFSAAQILLVFMWRHKILKSKLARPAKFLLSPGEGTTKIYFFYSFQLGSILCVQNTASWTFQISAVRDLKTAPWQSCLVWTNGLFLWFLAVWTVKALREVIMCMYTSSRGKSNRSHSKTEFQMFSLISGRHVGVPQTGHQHGVSILSSINLRGTFRQITEERFTAQTRDLEELSIY